MKKAMIGITAMALAATLGPRGAVAQCCGDCNGDGAVTVEEIIKAVNHTLGGCSDDRICSVDTCPGELARCRSELATCRDGSDCRAFPASGQTTAYGPGSDGAVRAGAALSYTDNGDGTITDNNTGRMWEKKDDSGGIHGVNNVYTWGMTSSPYTMNGTIVTSFLRTLNSEPCFAGHCDWRIPNVKELQSIIDYEIPYPGPAVNAAFHNAAGCPGCTDVTRASCTCTASPNPYWSSTTVASDPNYPYPNYAWYVRFGDGYVYNVFKNRGNYVRAVRGGF